MPEATATAEPAKINGIPLHAPGEHLPQELLRQRACTELLRQQAQQQGLLAQDDPQPQDGATSAAATAAIEQLLEQALTVPEPSEDACRRYHSAHPTIGARGERAHLRHILFAVTPGVNVTLLRQRAEALLLELRCADEGGPAFAEAARKWSNCPSGAEGGDLGWLTREDCAPEFARDVFEGQEIGVLARLVHSRFGLHVVQVCARQKPETKPFEQVHEAVAQQLRHQTWLNALRQYLQLLAGEAEVVGIDLDAASSPLVQ
ncbi:peptidylprolyl isomerase [Comamonas nitrativorans]|uniref:peptidylprolyl isomerase n=1 Tax=Comamonas nitrativorans TaxID=108437 RepID=A0ABV9GWU4_9BURK